MLVSFVSPSLPVCSGVNANQNQLSFISPAASAVLHLEIAVYYSLYSKWDSPKT